MNWTSMSKAFAGFGITLGLVSGQTAIDLRTQSKGAVDFQNAPYTKPLKTGNTLPATCRVNELFFLTTAPTGSNIFSCNAANHWSLQGGLVLLGGDVSGASTNTVVQKLQTLPVSSASPGLGQALAWDGTAWTPKSIANLSGDVSGPINGAVVTKLQTLPVSASSPQIGQALVWNGSSWVGTTLPGTLGTISLENAGAAVGTRGVENFVAGAGLVNVLTDTGTQINIQQSADTAILLSRASMQAGPTTLCSSTSATANVYKCAMNPTLQGYTHGMVVQWSPDQTNTGNPTLEIDALGAKSIKTADGLATPQPGDIIGGAEYSIWYDGTSFRLISAPLPLTGSAGTRPTCSSGYRGRIWQTFGAAGVKDTVAVCAKDSSNVYGWQGIY